MMCIAMIFCELIVYMAVVIVMLDAAMISLTGHSDWARMGFSARWVVLASTVSIYVYDVYDVKAQSVPHVTDGWIYMYISNGSMGCGYGTDCSIGHPGRSHAGRVPRAGAHFAHSKPHVLVSVVAVPQDAIYAGPNWQRALRIPSH